MPQISVPLRLLLAAGSFGAWFTAAFVFHVKDRSAFSTVSYVVPGYALIAAGCIGLMLAFMGIQRVPGWLSYLGRISYGLYVFHEFAIRELAAHRWQHIAKKHNLPDNTLITFSVALLGSLLLAALSYRYFEAPFRRLKDKEAVIHSQPATALVE
jgi:peptidoglycan/LPS O-acetylase OafA/YrhL